MKALIKTLIGDRYNALVVSFAVSGEILLVTLGRAVEASVLVPVGLLAAAAWLARRA